MADKKDDSIPMPPTLVGMSIEQLQAILSTLGSTSASAMKDAIRSQRKENPNYPEKSVFNPTGSFTDEGVQLPPRVKLSRPTFFVGVRLSDELLTADEIALCNRFAEAKFSRDGFWKAEIEGQGSAQRLLITVPCKTVDDRMSLPPFTHILRELLAGQDAVNPDTLAKQVEALQAQVAALQNRTTAA